MRLREETRLALVRALDDLEALRMANAEAAAYMGASGACAESLAEVRKLRLELDPTHRHCCRCGPQPIENFYVCRKGKFGTYYQSYCKDCNTAMRAEQRALRKKIDTQAECGTDTERGQTE